jgi:uncharacterized membrane protein
MTLPDQGAMITFIPMTNSKKGHGGPPDDDFWIIAIVLVISLLIIWGIASLIF